MEIETERLLIRRLQQEDLGALDSILGNGEVMRYSLSGTLTSAQVARFFSVQLEAYANRLGMHAAIEKKSGQLIGLIGFLSQELDNQQEVELSYRLHPNFWGKGLAQEAAFALCQFAFSELALDHLISIIDLENGRSIKLAERLGMALVRKSTLCGFNVAIYRLDRLDLVDYQEGWKLDFEKERAHLETLLSPLKIALYHIGSTSLPACAAKPIIDILGVVEQIEEVDGYNDRMREAGFEPLGEYGIHERRFFRKRRGVKVNLHVFDESNPEIERHLHFTRYLKEHPEWVKVYSDLKRKNAEVFPHDINAYIIGKERLIKEIDILAAESYPEMLARPSSNRHKSLWDRPALLHALESNAMMLLKLVAHYSQLVRIQFQNDVTLLISDLPSERYNRIYLAKFTESNASRRIHEVLKVYEHTPFFFLVCL